MSRIPRLDPINVIISDFLIMADAAPNQDHPLLKPCTISNYNSIVFQALPLASENFISKNYK